MAARFTMKGIISMETYRVFVINPGSTSTKIALFESEICLYSKSINHTAEEIAQFAEIFDQLSYREDCIRRELDAAGVSLAGVHACVGRGGGVHPCPAGVYVVDEKLKTDLKNGVDGHHASCMGGWLADAFAGELGVKAYIADQPTADEFEPVSRVTGLKGLIRVSRNHVLNEKEAARRAAAQLGITYEDGNFVVVHAGGGLSVAAHKKGRLVDSMDCLKGEGAFTGNRSGTVVAADLVELCFSGEYTKGELLSRITRSGGLIDHLGTADMIEVERRIAEGDKYASLVYRGMVHQIAKQVGAYATALKGEVDAIVLTGGMVYGKDLVERLKEYISYLAPVIVFPGEFEMEALAGGGLRVLRGEEKAKKYPGKILSDDLRDYA